MKKTILVIEDDYGIRTNIRDILTFEHFDVLLAKDGIEGCEKAKEYLPDLIICDIMIPKINGYKVLARLRSDPHTALIPFIFLTAKGSKYDLRKGMNLGADDYITKPFKINELMASINARLEKQQDIDHYVDRIKMNITNILPHELKTPLSTIKGFTEILCESKELGLDIDTITDIARTISKSEERLERIVKNYTIFTDFTIYDKDAPQLEKWIKPEERFSRQIIVNMIVDISEYYGRFDDLNYDICDKKIKLQINSFIKILEELLVNAFKFSKKGTPVHVSTYIENGEFILKVKDDGRGMKITHIENIAAFRQFERKRYEQQGSGLGLYIVKKLIELNNWKMNIESQESKGTIVTVKFPIDQKSTTL